MEREIEAVPAVCKRYVSCLYGYGLNFGYSGNGVQNIGGIGDKPPVFIRDMQVIHEDIPQGER